MISSVGEFHHDRRLVAENVVLGDLRSLRNSDWTFRFVTKPKLVRGTCVSMFAVAGSEERGRTAVRDDSHVVIAGDVQVNLGWCWWNPESFEWTCNDHNDSVTTIIF